MATHEHLCSAWLLQRVLAPSLFYDIRFLIGNLEWADADDLCFRA